VSWEEIERGIAIEDFRLDNMVERVKRVGDLFRPVHLERNRVKLEPFL
jgi:bifunctional non-homologous end joining protein LigD